MENLKQQSEGLNLRFNALHKKLLDLKEWELASDLSDVYHKSSLVEYKSGIEFMKNLYNL